MGSCVAVCSVVAIALFLGVGHVDVHVLLAALPVAMVIRLGLLVPVIALAVLGVAG